MKQLLTLILAITFLSFYSCKKEDDNNNPPVGNDSTEVEDTIKTFDSTQIKIDEKYANVNWEDLNLTDTCVMDICFDCGDLDRTNQAFYNQLQTAFETDCEECLTQALDSWNSFTTGGNPDNENDTIQELYKLFGSFYSHHYYLKKELREKEKTLNKSFLTIQKSDFITIDLDKPIYIDYDFDYNSEVKGNEKSYPLVPKSQYGNIKFLDINQLEAARKCYLLNFSSPDELVPENLKKFIAKKRSFLFSNLYNFRWCTPEDDINSSTNGCYINDIGKIMKITFNESNGVINKASIDYLEVDLNFKEFWKKDANDNWVKEETENNF